MLHRDYATMGSDFNFTTWATNTFSWGVAAGALLGFLPPIAALISIVLGLLLIYENRTFQHWYNNQRQKRAAKRFAKFKAKALKEEAVIKAVNLINQARVDARQVVVDAEAVASHVMATEIPEKPPFVIPGNP